MSEIEAVEALHRAAQARLGLAVGLLSRTSWGMVQATRPAETATAWLTSTTDAIMAARQLSAALAQSYYQLARAVEIGVTLGALIDGRPATLGNLRDAFLTQAMAVANIGNDVDASAFHALFTPDIGDGALEQVDILPHVQRFLDESNEADDSRTIRTEEFNWPTVRTGDEILASIQKKLSEKAIAPLAEEVKRKTRGEGDKKLHLRSINAAHQAKGELGAGRADNLAINIGRDMIEHAVLRDRFVLKFARGLGPNPCHWCAMLASRGFVYNSRQSAGSTMRDGGMRAWHDNCHCFPIARWVKESPLPPMNQFFMDNWAPVTKSVTGKEKLRVWRKWVAEQREAGNFPTT